MGTLNEDLSAIKEVEDKIVANKVARFAYTDEAYTTNDANGVAEYDVSKEQNIPTADASVLKVNETVLSKGYRAQASSVTRMLLNHFFGRMSYNLNKVNDIVSNLIATLIGHRGTANGFATLDENGRIPYSQLPESAMEYKGQWNAETNTPTLADGTGSKGDFYIVSVGGTQNLGSGNIQFSANDRIIYDGSVWARLSAGAVQTVNNISPENGNVTLTGENIPVSASDTTLLSAPLTTERIADNAVTNEKIKDPVSVTKGGTGATDAKNGFMNLANGLTQSQNPQDAEYMIYKSAGGWGLYTLLQFWEYIKDKISSVLGLTSTQYNGNAKTATTANTATSTNYWSAKDTGFTGDVNDLAIGSWNSVNTEEDSTQNMPYKGGWATVLTFAANNNPSYKQQICFYSGANAFYIRTCISYTWSNWARLAKTFDTVSNAYSAYSGMVHTCSTASSTKDKTVSIPGFTLTQGACIRVVFDNGNSATRPTLNVNNTGAKEICGPYGELLNAIVTPPNTSASGEGICNWDYNIVLDLYYNGTEWRVIGDPIVLRFSENSTVHKNISMRGNLQTSILRY